MRIDAIARSHVQNAPASAAHVARVHNANDLASAAEIEPSAPRTQDPATPTTWSTDDVEAFAVFAEANRRTESGHGATFSTLRTTAGASHRASFGVAQLSIREHLGRLARSSDAELARLGTSRLEVDAMRARGEATVAFYHLLVDRRDVEQSASSLGLDAAGADRVRALTSAGQVDALRSLMGARFEELTGLPASALDELITTRALREPSLRAAFMAQFAHDHGVAFDPAHRDAARMAISAAHVASSHAELGRALTALGGDASATTSLAHYLGVGDSAENLLGWHARGAATACNEARLSTLLASVDATTSHGREIEDFERALAAVARVDDLQGDARLETLARIGRIFHGSPTHARASLFVDGRLDAPRCGSRAEHDALLDEMRAGRRWSDARLASHVASVLAERRGT